MEKLLHAHVFNVDGWMDGLLIRKGSVGSGPGCFQTDVAIFRGTDGYSKNNNKKITGGTNN